LKIARVRSSTDSPVRRAFAAASIPTIAIMPAERKPSM